MSKKVKLFTNEHGIEMLEITGKTRNTFISLAKAKSILKANDSETEWVEESKYGRTLYQVPHGKKYFLAGNPKIDAVVNNASKIRTLGATVNS